MVSEVQRFELYWVNWDPTVGREIKKVRPAVILSPDELNRCLSTVVIAPLTSTLRPWPFRPTVSVAGKEGQIAVDQLRAVDKVRLGARMGVLSAQETAALLGVIAEFFAE